MSHFLGPDLSKRAVVVGPRHRNMVLLRELIPDSALSPISIHHPYPNLVGEKSCRRERVSLWVALHLQREAVPSHKEDEGASSSH